MVSPPASRARVFFHTLGCPKNEADSRWLMRAMVEAGVEVVGSPEDCSHVLVNTCGFIQDAKEESIEAILSACARYPERSVLVMGCLVERYRAELEKGIPEVGAWFGLVGQQALAELLRALGAHPVRARGETSTCGCSREPFAYLKISDGCDELCTFCAIPGIKGPYYSLGLQDILREADRCLADGARELVLVGQDTTRWRDDDLTLADLLDALAADERVYRLRVMYLQPERVTDEYLRYMAGQSKLCRYLDIPFQHSHPHILAMMGRQGDGDQYLALIDRARRLMPDVAIRSTFIVGFPGEREEHFEHLLDFVEAAGFDYAGGFVYSPEEGTRAAELRPRVGRSVAAERLRRLNSLLAECAERRHQDAVDATVEVMIDSIEQDEGGRETVAIGRTPGQAPEVDGVTYIEGGLGEGTEPGDLVRVTVHAAIGYDLVGECDGAY